MATLANDWHSWQDVDREIIDRLDIRQEAKILGLSITGSTPSPKGWIACRAIGCPDQRTPSAGINVSPPGEKSRGRYKDFKSGDNLSFFDLCSRLAPHRFATWKDARNYYADVLRIDLPSLARHDWRDVLGVDLPSPSSGKTDALTLPGAWGCEQCEHVMNIGTLARRDNWRRDQFTGLARCWSWQCPGCRAYKLRAWYTHLLQLLGKNTMVWFLPIRKTDNMGEPSWGALCKRLNRAGADYVWDRLSASASPLGVDTFMVFTNCAYERPPYSRPFIPGDLEDALNGILIADDRKCPIKASPAWSLPENKTGEYRKIQCQNADPERTLKVLHAFGIKSRSRGPRGKLTYTISWNIPEEWSEEDHIYQDFLASLRHGSIIRTPRPLASHSHLNFSENKRKTDMLVEYENLDFSTLESADECNLILTG